MCTQHQGFVVVVVVGGGCCVDDVFMWVGVGVGVYVVHGIELRRFAVSMQVVGSWRGWILGLAGCAGVTEGLGLRIWWFCFLGRGAGLVCGHVHGRECELK